MLRMGKLRDGLLASGAAAALLATATPATAGGFAVREQSAEFQGMSFAGNAAGGGGLSGMFWNPAVTGQFNGIVSESHYAYILPDSEITALPGSTLSGILPSKSGNIGKEALVGASYLSYQLSNRVVFGFSFNAPFGLTTEPSNRFWAGQNHTRTSEIKTYNGQAALAYRVNDQLIVGAGLMIQRMEGRLKNASGITTTAQNIVIEGDDTAFGFTLGALWRNEHTSLGIGFRSSIDQTLEGNIFLAGNVAGLLGGPGGVGSASIRAGVTLPETVTASLRHELTSRWAVLGTIEWTNWSRVQKLDVVCTSASTQINLLGCPGPGALQSSLPLNWHDGWMFALGVEHAYNEKLKLRSGIAYEISPIQNASERTPRVPDADRVWASVGLTYKWSEMVSLDLAYSHIFVEDARIDRTQSGIRLFADVDSSVDIIAASLKVKLGDVAPPLK